MPVLYLTEADVARVLTIDLALDAVAAAFRKLAIEEAVNVPRQRCQTDHVMLHVLPAAAKTLGVVGYKAYTTTKAGARFYVTLFDGKTGEMTAILEADLLGQFRTGAASGVATKKLSRTNSSTLGCLGTGKQARTQVLAVCRVRPIKKVVVYSRDADRRTAFATQLSAETAIEVVAVGKAEAAVREMDIVCTATTSREPVLLGVWVTAGQHLNLAGSNMITKAEADIDVFRKAIVVTVDDKEQAKSEAGDFAMALNAGVLSWSDILDFPPLYIGRYPGRESPDDITLFKSLGLGIQDIALAARVVELARAQGLGREIM